MAPTLEWDVLGGATGSAEDGEVDVEVVAAITLSAFAN